MIDIIVIVISAIVFALLLVWWRWPALRDRMEAPKYSMLRQERRFDERNSWLATGKPAPSLDPEDS
jgi:hypothetical protein